MSGSSGSFVGQRLGSLFPVFRLSASYPGSLLERSREVSQSSWAYCCCGISLLAELSGSEREAEGGRTLPQRLYKPTTYAPELPVADQSTTKVK
jgi:hypothetical protein